MLTFLVPFGALVRGLHFWGAQALVVVSAIHLLRILFTGAYTPPRRFNFLLGLVLFVLTLMFDFTGYVLRWDEGIRWALMVGTNLLKTIPLVGAQLYSTVIGGVKPGLATLTRFYTWHIFGLTVIMGVILVWHLFRVRRDGGISAPPPELRRDPRRITRYELVQREVLAMLIASLALILVSLLLPAPLAPPIQDTPVIARGEVRILRQGRQGDVEVARMRVGDCFGEMCILERLPRAATVEATQDTHLLMLSYAAFDILFDRMPREHHRVLGNIARTLSSRIRELGDFLALRG